MLAIGSIHEIVFLVLVTGFVVTALAVTKGQWTWLIGIPICVAIAVLVTPADVGSTFIVAAPYPAAYRPPIRVNHFTRRVAARLILVAVVLYQNPHWQCGPNARSTASG